MRYALKPLLIALLSVAPVISVADEMQFGAISIIESEGELIHLDEPAATLFVADPTIASVQVISNRTVFVLAHEVGKTTLFALDEQEEVMFEREVVVQKSLQHLQRDLSSETGG
ncbi:pilus assembly protein N-terminal domain-containing protein [Aestuariibius sp. 2305UL40-4]|uniref:pilus assembly protein N-terminal domain-containing protein n=1 Tax=Aestuariibius violaceus TaxID=3234132 RepID=UPI00345E8E4A